MRRIRVLLGQIGIDAHDRGVRTVALILRDAGMEVIYTGPWQTIEALVAAAIQEDVDIIGISTLGGDYILIPKLMERMQTEGVNIPVVLGGIVPSNVEKRLMQIGVAAVFHPGSGEELIVTTISDIVKQARDGHPHT